MVFTPLVGRAGQSWTPEGKKRFGGRMVGQTFD